MEEVLAHYGVLGMHWGIHKKEDHPGRKMSAKDQAFLKKAGVDPRHSESLKAKYGPGSNKESNEEFHLTPTQKKVLIGVGVGVGVAAAVGAAYYFHNKGPGFDAELEALKKYIPKPSPDGTKSPSFQKEWAAYQEQAGARLLGMGKHDYRKLSDEPTNLPIGHILKRVTTEKETTIRPGGFFAAHDQADVERYKAILPVFWKQWGQTAGKKEGYVVNLAAKVPIKAPSEKETFNLLKSMLNDQVPVKAQLPSLIRPQGGPTSVKFRDMFWHIGPKDTDHEAALAVFPHFSQLWADGADKNPAVQHFFKKVKEAGYNALPDINDAGALAKRPLRTLDGSIFEIVGHEPLSKEAIVAAQQGIQAIAHRIAMLINNLFYEPLGGGTMELTHQEQRGLDFLEHHGVLGMKWGHRKRASTVQIKAARGRVATEKNKLDRAESKAAHLKDPKQRAAAEKNVAKMKLHFLNNPDRVASARMTRGEKAVSIILGLSVVGVGVAPGLAVISGTSARSRRIERKQETGAYTKQFNKQNKK